MLRSCALMEDIVNHHMVFHLSIKSVNLASRKILTQTGDAFIGFDWIHGILEASTMYLFFSPRNHKIAVFPGYLGSIFFPSSLPILLCILVMLNLLYTGLNIII